MCLGYQPFIMYKPQLGIEVYYDLTPMQKQEELRSSRYIFQTPQGRMQLNG